MHVLISISVTKIYSYYWECILLISIIKMLKWGIFNASVLLNEHGHPLLLFQN